MAKKAALVGTSEFPLFLVRVIDDHHFLVAGGGGKSKTGIPNAIEIYRVAKNEKGEKNYDVLTLYDTEDKPVMNGIVISESMQASLATGQDEFCYIYQLHCKMETLRGEDRDRGEFKWYDLCWQKGNLDGVRKRRTNMTESRDHNRGAKAITFDVKKVDNIQTDFEKKGNPGFQKAVAITTDCSLLVTAGADGHIRTWKYPSLEKLYEIKAHKDEVDDISISPSNDRICSVSRDLTTSVWKTVDGKKICDLPLPLSSTGTYRARCCRYARVSDKKGKEVLFTAHIPANHQTKGSYVAKWDVDTNRVKIVKRTGDAIISAIEDGVFLGLGTVTGDVSVLIAFSLTSIYVVKEAHSIFVTSLDFTRMNQASRELWGSMEFSLLSVSADNRVLLHQKRPANTYSALWVIAGFIFIIYLTFWLMAYLGI